MRGKRHRELLYFLGGSCLALLALGMIFGLPMVLFLESFSAPSTQPDYFRFDAGDRSTVKILLQSFDPDSRVVTASATLEIVDSRLVSKIGTPEEIKSLFVLGEELSTYPLQRQADSTYRVDEIRFRLVGDPTRFPFDRYEGAVQIGASAPAGFYVEEKKTGRIWYPPVVPARLEVRRLFPGFDTSFENFFAQELGDEPVMNTFTIRMSRTFYDPFAFILAEILFLGLILIAFVASLTELGAKHPLEVLLGVAGIGVALPGIRDLIVPDGLDVRTVVDVYLVIPFFVGAILTCLVVGAKTVLPAIIRGFGSASK